MRKTTIAAGGITLLALLACSGGEEPTEETPAEEAPAEEAPANEGTPLSPTPAAVDLAGSQVTAEVCALTGASFTGDSTMDMFNGVVAVGDRLMVVDGEGVIHGFDIGKGGCALSVASGFGSGGTVKTDKEIEHVSKASNGTVVASNGIFEAYLVDANGKTTPCATKGYVELSDDGSWGIAPWVNSTVKLAEVTSTGCTSTDWVLKDLSNDEKREGAFTSVNASTVLGDTIYIGGSLAKNIDPEGTRVIGKYNKAGKELGRFGGSDDVGSPEGFGWVHDITGCAPGVCVLDSNFRRITAWDDKGKYVGTVDLKTLLGLDYAWIADMDVAADGSVYLVAANKRSDGDMVDGFIYRISGLGVASEAAPPAEGARSRPARSGGGGGERRPPPGARRQRPK